MGTNKYPQKGNAHLNYDNKVNLLPLAPCVAVAAGLGFPLEVAVAGGGAG